MNTVFVIGAGASKEAGLPIGVDLKKTIAQFLDIRYDIYGHRQESGDLIIKEALRLHTQSDSRHPGDINPYLREAWHIRDALPQAISIDNFIDNQKGNDKLAICGKLAIVRSILEAEKNSKLYVENTNTKNTINFDALEGTWYDPFFKLLSENCDINNIEERFKLITLIIFNYDRCVEHFIYHSLQNYYKISDTKAAQLVKVLKIYHPYGVVGSLPWLKTTEAQMEYGGEPNPQLLLDLSKQIKTFTEGVDPQSSEIAEIKSSIHDANKIIFLGFAFHKLNMQLITPSIKSKVKGISSFASTFDVSDSDRTVIRNQIQRLYPGRVVTINTAPNKKCCELFKEYGKSIAFE